MDVFFSADQREEYLDLLSQSVSKHALDFLAWWECVCGFHNNLITAPLHRPFVPTTPIRLDRSDGMRHREIGWSC